MHDHSPGSAAVAQLAAGTTQHIAAALPAHGSTHTGAVCPVCLHPALPPGHSQLLIVTPYTTTVQARRESLPWIQDLLLPLLDGPPQPLEGALLARQVVC